MSNRTRKSYTIDQVFGLHRGDTLNYVERPTVDFAFIEHLSREKHISIYGCSKQGKTSLRKKHLSDNEQLLITCDPSWDIMDLHAAILKSAGCTILTKEKQRDTASGGTLWNQRTCEIAVTR